MCYHYSLSSKALRSENRYGFIEDYSSIQNFDTFYHINGFDFPILPVIANDHPQKIQLFQWGLIPGWVKTSFDAQKIRTQTLNARLDSLYEKPAYRSTAKSGKRCLIPADGIFEWRTIGKKKYPYYITFRNHEIFSIAGVWDEWHDKESGETVKTFSMVTTIANLLMETIQNISKRMPLILAREFEQIWLDDNLTYEEVMALGKPISDKGMKAHTISKLITSKGVDTNISDTQKPYFYPELSLTLGF
jgi:putative SOS response-associated peptidase YedK